MPSLSLLSSSCSPLTMVGPAAGISAKPAVPSMVPRYVQKTASEKAPCLLRTGCSMHSNCYCWLGASLTEPRRRPSRYLAMTESNISEGWRETKPSIGMGRMLSSDPQGRHPSGRTAIQPLRQPFNPSRRPEPRPLPCQPLFAGSLQPCRQFRQREVCRRPWPFRPYPLSRRAASFLSEPLISSLCMVFSSLIGTNVCAT